MSLAIVLLTAEGPKARRTKYAVETVDHLRRNVISDEPIWWHIADDGSGRTHMEKIHDAAYGVTEAEQGHAIGHWSFSDSEGRGYGPNVNASRDLMQAESPPEFVLYVEDDWRLARPLDLRPMFYMLRHEDFEDVGMVRLSYMAWTKPLFALFRWDDHHQWLELRRDSEEPFIFSGNPRLEHWDFLGEMRWAKDVHELQGRGGLPGEYELDIVWRLKTRDAGARTEIVFPCDFIPAGAGDASLFQHFGAERSFIHDE